MNADDQALFDGAHARLEEYLGHPTVQEAVTRFLKGALTLAQFLEALLAVPEVKTVLEGIAGGAVAAIPGVGAYVAPLVPFALRAIEWAASRPKAA